ncbi:MAG: hypothetical protein KHZ32_03435 [Actinomyces sp.]|nr:hypothetical protein [Actinomyces sp.]
MMHVKGDNGIEFALADEVATAMITAGILEEAASGDETSDGEDAGPPEADLEQETPKKSKK